MSTEVTQKKSAIIDFMGLRKAAITFSLVLLTIAIGSLLVKKLALGFDFVGGLQVDAAFAEPVDVDSMRSKLGASGFTNASVVLFGSDRQVKVRLEQKREEIIAQSLQKITGENSEISIESFTPRQNERLQQGGTIILVSDSAQASPEALQYSLAERGLTNVGVSKVGEQLELITTKDVQLITADLFTKTLFEVGNGKVEIQEMAFLSSNIGKELRDEGGLGLLLALVVVMIYVAVRFQYKFSVGAVSALVHDVIIVLGFFSLLGLDFDLTVLAALLAVIGYSLNDTIVVADRIRENFRLLRKGSPTEIINISLTQTLGRTLITSITTLLVLFALLLFGGEALRGFSIALIVGVVVGTYSSIYVSANILLSMHISKEDLMPPEKEGEGELVDDMP